MLEATAGSLVYVPIWINAFNCRCRLNVGELRLAEVPPRKYSKDKFSDVELPHWGVFGSSAETF
jgi:hypothetical protein